MDIGLQGRCFIVYFNVFTCFFNYFVAANSLADYQPL
jgi:hypothetical protein